MIYGELGRCPLHIDIKQLMVSYWTKLKTGKQSNICSVVHRLMYHLRNTQNAIFSWLNSVQTIVQKEKQRSTKDIYKTKDRIIRTPLKTTGVELRCSRWVSSSCPINYTRRVNLVANPVISHE
jgi:hypothetical protein